MRHSRIRELWLDPPSCAGCAIRAVVSSAGMDEKAFGVIHRPIEEVTLERGETLYTEGEKAGSVYTLRRCLMKLAQYLPDGTQRIVRLVRRGSSLGLEGLVAERYEHAAVVMRRAELCRIPVAEMRRMDAEIPGLHMQLMSRWHQALHQADSWLTGLSTGSAQARIARLVLHVLPSSGGPADHECELFSREEMGAMLGVTTETTSRTIAEFRRRGLLRESAPNRFFCDRVGLERIAGEGG